MSEYMKAISGVSFRWPTTRLTFRRGSADTVEALVLPSFSFDLACGDKPKAFVKVNARGTVMTPELKLRTAMFRMDREGAFQHAG
jgi:hypothetical protein